MAGSTLTCTSRMLRKRKGSYEMATLAERLREQVERAKKAQATKGSVANMVKANTDTARLAEIIRARQAGGSKTK